MSGVVSSRECSDGDLPAVHLMPFSTYCKKGQLALVDTVAATCTFMCLMADKYY